MAGDRADNAFGSAEGMMIAALRTGMVRHPGQLNDAFETDAELLDLGGDELLAVTMDTVNRGAELVLAPSPYEKGWLTITVSMSDLLAVGARPISVLLSCCLPRGQWSERDAQAFGRGASAAARAHEGYIIGGDTNWAEEESFTSCAIGMVPRDRFLCRSGAKPGHVLYVTGRIGAGNATGFRNSVLGSSVSDSSEPMWLPVSPCAATDSLRQYARACIDTSDGLLAAAEMLAAVSKVGIEIEERDELYQLSAGNVADQAGLPRWLLAAGEWGEYELLFAVRPGPDEHRCLAALAERGVHAVRAGVVTADSKIVLRTQDGTRHDARRLLNRLRMVRADGELLDALYDLVTELRQGAAR